MTEAKRPQCDEKKMPVGHEIYKESMTKFHSINQAFCMRLRKKVRPLTGSEEEAVGFVFSETKRGRGVVYNEKTVETAG